MCDGTGANLYGAGRCQAVGCVDGRLVDPPDSSGAAEGCVAWILGRVILFVGGIVLLLAVYAGVAIYRSVTSTEPGLLGDRASSTTWEGTYVCGTTRTRLRLELQVTAGDATAQRRAQATFAYLGSEAAPVPTSGAPTSTATGTLVGRELNLLGEPAAEGAPGFQIRGVRATVAEDARQMLGDVTAPECQSIGLALVD